MPKLENFLYYEAKIMIEIAWPCWHFLINIYSFENDWTDEFFRGNCRVILDCQVYLTNKEA